MCGPIAGAESLKAASPIRTHRTRLIRFTAVRTRYCAVLLVSGSVTALVPGCGSGDYVFDSTVGTEDDAGGAKLDGSSPDAMLGSGLDAQLTSIDARTSTDANGSPTDAKADAKDVGADVGAQCNAAQCTTPPSSCYDPAGSCADAGGKCAYKFKMAGSPCTGGMCDGAGLCMSMPDAAIGED